MKNADEIKRRFDDMATALERDQDIGRERYQAVCRMGDRFRCEVEVGGGKTVVVGVPVSLGGDDSGPTPGQLMRASLAACLTVGYAMWAARLEVPVDDIQVTVHATSDARGQLLTSADVPAGWLTLGHTVTMVSSADEESLRRVIETADRLSPMLNNLVRAFAPERQLVVRRPETREA